MDDLFSYYPVIDNLVKGDLPTFNVGIETKTLVELGGILVISFSFILFFGLMAYKKFK